jgi:PAS domain S-box-containing protein
MAMLGLDRNGQPPTLLNSPEQPFQTAEEAEAALEQLASTLPPEPFPALVPRASEDEAELQLGKAQARYRALVEQIPAITFLAPLDGTASELYVSPQIEKMLGFTAEEWLSNPILWYSQLHPDDQDRWQAEFSGTLNAGEHFCSDYRFLSREGKIVWIHGEAKVISDDQGRPLFLQGVAFDITEQKEAEETLQANNAELARARDQAMVANRAKSAFLANMSHELRTPLHAILGFAEMLLEDVVASGQERFLPDIQKITGAANHLVALIGNILDLSKIEAGKMDLFLEDVTLGSLIQEVVSSVLPLVKEQGNTLEIEGDKKGMVHVDAVKVRQILLNLISNACKFTENGVITLEVRRESSADGDWIRFRVADTGIGMTPEQMTKLFQSFSQGDESKRTYGGTGLGLAISQRFCRLMRGKISVKSDRGKGSTFTVEIPAQVEELTEEVKGTVSQSLGGAEPHLPALPIADCRLPIADWQKNPQSAIGNRQSEGWEEYSRKLEQEVELARQQLRDQLQMVALYRGETAEVDEHEETIAQLQQEAELYRQEVEALRQEKDELLAFHARPAQPSSWKAFQAGEVMASLEQLQQELWNLRQQQRHQQARARARARQSRAKSPESRAPRSTSRGPGRQPPNSRPLGLSTLDSPLSTAQGIMFLGVQVPEWLTWVGLILLTVVLAVIGGQLVHWLQ